MLKGSALVLLVLLLTSGLCSQELAVRSWKGELENDAGGAIKVAQIHLIGGHGELVSETDSQGRFQFPKLPPGSYQLVVVVNGVGHNSSRILNLKPDSPEAIVSLLADDSVSVTFQADTAKGTGGEQLSAQTVSAIPLNKRDFSQLLLLAAGTMTDSNGQTNFTQQFAINGQRGVEAVFAMDGADTSDPEMGGATFSNFNVDAVEEIKSVSGWMPAEIGRGAAGFTDIITRSGASGFHGSIFEFVRNSAFDARNYFDHPTPAYPGRIPP